jgi:general stress protein CsbA
MCDEIMVGGLEDTGSLLYIEQSCYLVTVRSHVPRAKIRTQSPVLAVVLLAILVMASAVLGWLGGLVAWLIVLGALAVFAFCLRGRP